MTEYAIVVALVAVAAIATIIVFSQNIRAVFSAAANELAGSEQSSGTSAGAQKGTIAGRKRMSNFGTALAAAAPSISAPPPAPAHAWGCSTVSGAEMAGLASLTGLLRRKRMMRKHSRRALPI